jgi:Ala-tRNA(Pro) deacylase
VVLKKPDDTFIVMALPADCRVHLGRLRALLDAAICLATEQELAALFPDCSVGAIPALGAAYGLRTLVDRSLFEQPEVFIESGDHETLVQLSCEQLGSLVGDSERIEAARHL